MTSTQLQVAEALERAAGFVDKGFCKMFLGMDARGFPCKGVDPGAVQWCAIEAMHRADVSRPEQLSAFAQWLREERGVHGDVYAQADSRAEIRDTDLVAGWNNAKERTQQEVSAALRACAASLRGAP